MPLKIMRLEERIVLEGTGFDVDDSHANDSHDAGSVDGVDVLDADTSAALEHAAAAADTDGSSDSHDAATPVPDGETAHAFDGEGGAAPAAGVAEGVRVLVVQGDIADAGDLAEAAAEGVRTVVYDPSSVSLEALLAQITEALNGDKAELIGFAVHDSGPGEFQLTDNQVVSIMSLVMNDGQQSFWQGVGELVGEGGRVDIMSCNLAATDSGLLAISEIENLTGVEVAASDDLTGNADDGGDWILEKGGVDLADTYFDSDDLGDFDGTLAAPDVTLDAGSLSYTENDAWTQVSSGATVSDAEHDWDGGTLAVQITANNESTDEIIVQSGIGNVVVSGTDVSVNSTLIGTMSATSVTDGDVLTITFNASADDAAVQEVLQAISYRSTSDVPGTLARTVTFIATDANSETEGANTRDITVDAVNDAPVNSVPGAQTVNEDTSLIFNVANSNLISISDVDSGGSDLQVTLTATNGAMSLSGTTGLTFTTGDGTSDGTMVFTGTAAAINTALDGLVFTPTADYSGAASIQIATDDQGNTGTGGAQSDTDTINITVDAVNDAPVNSVPSAQTVNEDTSLTFSTGNGNLISVADVDLGGGDYQVTLTATNGTITLATTASLSFSTGDGTDDTTVTFTGNAAKINAALDGLVFAPTADYSGAASIQIATSDQGNTGSGGAQSDTDTVNITVSAVNDAPVNSVPSAQTVNEDTSLTFNVANSNLISISDVDSGSSDLQVTLTATNGVMSLSGTTGLAFTTGDGTSDGTMVFTGTAAAINTALDGLVFAPTADYSGAASIQIATDDQGNTGTGGALSDTDTINITVDAVNDAPVNSVPGAQTVNEDTSLTFNVANSNLISISDVDSGSSDLQVTLTATNGVMSLSGTTGLAFTTGDGTSDATMTFTGTVAEINAALDGLVFTPTADYSGAASIQIATDDQGNTGAGGAQSDTDTVSITVSAVNDAPTASDNTVTTNEDTAYTFAAGDFQFSDVDTGDTLQQVRVDTLPSAGVFELGGVAVTAGQVISRADINSGLLKFTPASDVNGASYATFNFSVNDGVAWSAAQKTMTIDVTAVNDAPVNSVPGAQTVNEDTSLTFNVANSNLISISDVDSGSSDLQVTLTATNGVMSLSGTTGLAFTTGDGTSDATMTFTGTVAEINAALDGLVFAPTADYSGAASIQIATDDQGNTGAGGAQSDTDTVNITVSQVNDAPTSSDASVNGIEDTTYTFASGNFPFSDIDTGDQLAGIVVSSLETAGDLEYNGVDVTVGQFISKADIDAGLLKFIPPANANGAVATFGFKVRDDSSSPSALESGQQTMTVNLSASNDAPVNSVPVAQIINEDTTLVFSSGNGNLISISDVDDGGSDLQVSLVVNNGTLSLSGTTGLAFTVGDGTEDATMTFTGSKSAINTALSGMSFIPTANYNGVAVLQISTSDQGNTGAGGAKIDNDTVNITINSVNDIPAITAPVTVQTPEGTPLNFGNTLQVNDPDIGATEIVMTITTTDGTLSLSQTTGLTFTVGDGTSDATMTFTGTQADINAALNNMVLTFPANFSASATVHVETSDQGSSGSGGVQTDSKNITVNVDSVNDAPVNTVPGAQTMNEDSLLVFNSANGNQISVDDIDLAGNDIQVTLTATNGTITLSQITGLSFSFSDGNGTGAGDGVADGTMTFRGSRVDVNAALNGMIFASSANFNGAASISLNSNDLGSTGTGGVQQDTDVVNITVNAVNDAPVVSIPAGPFTVNEQTSLTIAGTSVADPDAGASVTNQVTVTVDHGTVSLASTSGLTFISGDGSADGSMIFTGTLADINTALATLTYQNPSDTPSGSDAIRINYSDKGNSGSGGELTDNKVINVTVTPINDVPVITAPGTMTAYEDVSLAVSGVTIADADESGATNNTITVTAGNGLVTFADTAGLTLVAGANGTSSFTYMGSLAAINNALSGLHYLNTTELSANAADTLAVSYSDQGNSGTGGPQSDTHTINLTVKPTNDAPEADAKGDADFQKGGDPIYLSSNFELSDIDDTVLGSITVKIVDYTQGEDVLLYTVLADGKIEASWDSTTGTLELFPAGGPGVGITETIAVFQEALRNVRFQNASDIPDGSVINRIVSYTIADLNATGADNGVAQTTVYQNINLIGNAKTVSVLQEAPPPPSTSDSGGDSGDAGGDTTAAADAGVTADAGGSDTSSGADQVGSDDGGASDSGMTDHDDTADAADQGGGNQAAAELEAIQAAVATSSSVDTSLEAIRDAQETIEQSEMLVKTAMEGLPQDKAEAFVRPYLQQIEDLTVRVQSAADQLTKAIGNATADGGVISGLEGDIVSVDTESLEVASDELEILNLLLMRVREIIQKNPNWTDAQIREAARKAETEIRAEVAKARTKPGGVMEDAAEAALGAQNGQSGEKAGKGK